MSLEQNHSFLNRIGVAVRLAAKELYRLKLKRIDLPKADLRLGEKAYATGTANGQTELVSKLDELTQRVTQLRQQGVEPATTFGEKVKVFASKIAQAVQVGALQVKRRRILGQLGANLQNEANSSLAEETQVARGVADRLNSIEAEIAQFRRQTYAWARRPS